MPSLKEFEAANTIALFGACLSNRSIPISTRVEPSCGPPFVPKLALITQARSPACSKINFTASKSWTESPNDFQSSNDIEHPEVPPGGRDLQEPRRAITHVRPLELLRDYTVLECRLETGRTHQIRIHLSEIGHRLCGEKIYTHKIGQSSLPETSGAPRQALHAASLAFVHPITGQGLRFQMPLPKDLKTWLLKLPRR